MRNLTYLLTGTLLFIFIIVGCRENKSPSSSEPTSNPQKNESAFPKAASTLTASTDVDVNTSIYNAPIKRWGVQFNANNTVTALSYGTDVFTLQNAMMTSDEYPILISTNSLSTSRINILKLSHKSDMNTVLMGQIQTVTNPNVIQEISDLINGVEKDNTLNTYTEIESSEKVNFNISFYKASYSLSLPDQLVARFANRKRQAHIMIADTATAEDKQVGVSIGILSNSTPSYPVYQKPLYLSFQQPYEAFKTNSNNITALIEGLNIEDLDPLTMNAATDVESHPISFSFSQTLHIDGQETELQIEVTSNMEPLYFKASHLNKVSSGLSAFAQSIKSFFFPEDDNTEAVQEFDWNEIYEVPTGQTTQNNLPTPAPLDRTADQIQLQVQTSPESALREFEQQNTPILRFVEGIAVTPTDNCNSIYAQEGSSDNYRNCATTAVEAGSGHIAN